MLAISDFAKAEIWEKSIELLQELETEYRRTFEYAMLSDNLVTTPYLISRKTNYFATP